MSLTKKARADMPESKCPADFDFFDEEVLNCPYEFYQQLQEQAPVYNLPGTDIFMVSRQTTIKRCHDLEAGHPDLAC